MTLSSYFESKLKIICSLHCKILTSAPRTRTPSRARPSPTSPTRPTVINHNMNLQTALIINTLSKVLPNVPQSRLKNQPRLESVGAGIKFHQEEIFIFHTTLTELHVSFWLRKEPKKCRCCLSVGGSVGPHYALQLF